MERHSTASNQQLVCAEPAVLVLQETVLRGEELLDRIKAINQVLEESVYRLVGNPVASAPEKFVSSHGA